MSLDKDLLQGERAIERLSAGTRREVLRAYARTLREFRGTLADYAARYAKGGKMSYVEIAKYRRLESLTASVRNEMNRLYAQAGSAVTVGSGNAYSESYWRTAYALERQAQARLGWTLLNPATVAASVQNPISGMKLSERLQANRAQVVTRIRSEITQGLIRGEGYDDMARRIKGVLDGDAAKAIRVAQTEAHRVTQEGRLAALEQAERRGVKMVKVWTSTLDDRTRDAHQELDGQKAPVDGFFEIDGARARAPGGFGVPELDINCFPGDVRVTLPSAPHVLTRRWYEGDLIHITTSAGHELAGTPNHPVLTPDGWVPLGLLKKGGYVVRGSFGQRAGLADPDIDHDPTTLREMYDLAAVVGAVQRVAGRPQDFHGDGQASDVDIVAVNGQLEQWQEAAFLQPVGHGNFTLAQLGEGRLLSPGALVHLGLGSLTTPDRDVSGFGKTGTFLGASPGHPGIHAGAITARRDAVLEEDSPNDRTTDTVSLGQSILGLAGAIAVEKIVQVANHPFAHYVYNLQAASGWYLANDIVSHNCRCTIRGEIAGYEPQVRRARGEGVIPYKTYPEWKAARGTESPYEGPEPRVADIPTTIRGAEDFARESLGLETVNYGGLDVEVANGVNRQIEKTFEQFPELRGHFRTVEARNIRQGIAAEGGLDFVTLNRRRFGSMDLLNRGRPPAGFFSTPGPFATVSHEMGHVMDGYLNKHGLYGPTITDPYYSKVMRSRALKAAGIRARNIATELSEYATKNAQEFFAEAFAELIESSSPRPLAVAVRNELRAALSGIRGR